MAARRILTLLTTKHPHPSFSKGWVSKSCSTWSTPILLHKSFIAGSSWCFVSPARSFFGTDGLYYRRFQTIAETTKQAVEAGQSSKNCNADTKSDSAATAVSSIKSETTYKYAVQSNLKFSPRHDLLMIFTCRVCETRSTKSVCRESYEKGVVVARCDGCNNIHLIADRLGWFGEPGSVEDFLAAPGEEVKKGCPETLCLTPEDLAGKKILEDVGEK